MKRHVLLLQGLSIEPGESRVIGLLCGLSFFIGLTLVSFYTASNTLFLAAFGAENLPYGYIASAVVSSLTGWLYSHAKDRFAFPTMLLGTFVYLLITVLCLRLGLLLTPSPWPVFVLLIWFTVITALLHVVFWSLASRLLDVRQSKRLFGLVGAGELLASMAGGASIPLFLRYGATADLLIVTAGALGCGVVILRLLLIEYTQRTAALPAMPEEEEHPTAFSQLPKVPYIRLIFLIALITTLVFNFIDFSFLTQAEKHFQDEEALARFFGLFFAGAQALTLIILTFLTGRLLNRYGLKIGMRLCPTVLVICFAGLVLIGIILGPGQVFLWLVVGTKLLDMVMQRSLNAPAFLILLQPLKLPQRLATQLAVETMIAPIASAIAGLALLAVNLDNPTHLVYLSVITLAIVLGWTTLPRFVAPRYKAALAEALRRRRLGAADFTWDESVLHTSVTAYLDSPRPGEVIYALDLLERHSPQTIDLFLEPLLAHPAPEVKQDVLERIGQRQRADLLPAVQGILASDAPLTVQATALRTLCSLGEAEVLDEVTNYLDHPEMEIKKGGLAGLLQNGGIDGILLAGNHLLNLEKSPDSKARQTAAQVLGDVGNRSFYRPLLELLQDPEPEVRHIALEAAGRIGNPKLWPLLVSALAHETDHQIAADALVTIGAEVIDTLTDYLGETSSPQRLIRVGIICGRIGGPAAIALLLSHLDTPARDARSTVLSGLLASQYQATSPTAQATIRRYAQCEAEDAFELLCSLMDLGQEDAFQLLRLAVGDELDQIRRRIIMLLSFLHDPTTVQQAGEELQGSISAQRAYALEVFDTTLHPELKPILLPILEHLSPEDCYARLSPHFTPQLLGQVPRLEEFITWSFSWSNPWLRACALYAAGELFEGDEEKIAAALEAEEFLVRETAAWALAIRAPERLSTLTDPALMHFLFTPAVLDASTPSPWPTVIKVACLNQVDIFSEVPNAVLARMAASMRETFWLEEQQVYREGDEGKTLYVIGSGACRVHQGEKTLISLEENNFFGELTTLVASPHSATVTATRPSRLLELDRPLFYELMATYPEVARHIIQVLCRRLRRKLVAQQPS
jgi:AAA family ATP:ADP antiporter